MRTARAYDGVVISYVGLMSRQDLAAEMADLLLRLEGTRWVICTGAYRDDLILAMRIWSRRGGAGQLTQEMVGDCGTAGGQVSLDRDIPEALVQQFSKRALQHLRIASGVTGRPLI